nr:MAG TPA: hypothetical protein [Herelleviridae sp.]
MRSVFDSVLWLKQASNEFFVLYLCFHRVSTIECRLCDAGGNKVHLGVFVGDARLRHIPLAVVDGVVDGVGRGCVVDVVHDLVRDALRHVEGIKACFGGVLWIDSVDDGDRGVPCGSNGVDLLRGECLIGVKVLTNFVLRCVAEHGMFLSYFEGWISAVL